MPFIVLPVTWIYKNKIADTDMNFWFLYFIILLSAFALILIWFVVKSIIKLIGWLLSEKEA